MTGRYPHTQSGVYFLSPDLRQAPVLKNLKTLPEVFADHGYNTMAAGKIFHGGWSTLFSGLSIHRRLWTTAQNQTFSTAWT